MKNSIGNRTRYHPVSSAVPQPTVLPRAPKYQVFAINNELSASENVEIGLKHDMDRQPFYGEAPNPLLWAASWAARRTITMIGKRNCPNYCEIFVVYKQFTNVVAGRMMQPDGLRVGDPRFET